MKGNMNLEPIPLRRKITLAIIITAGIIIAISIQYFANKRIQQTNNLQQMFPSQHPFEDRARQITNEIENEIKLQREQADYAAWTNKMNQK